MHAISILRFCIHVSGLIGNTTRNTISHHARDDVTPVPSKQYYILDGGQTLKMKLIVDQKFIFLILVIHLYRITRTKC